MFVAQSPERILGLLRIQKREIEEKEREFIRIIAALESKYSKEKGEIKLYKGKEGLKVLEEILSFSPTPKIFVVNPKANLKPIFQKIKKRLGKLDLKEIKVPLEGTLIIFDKAIFLPSKKPEGFLIENPLIVNLLKSLSSLTTRGSTLGGARWRGSNYWLFRFFWSFRAFSFPYFQPNQHSNQDNRHNY